MIKFFVESKNKKACYNGQFTISDVNIKSKIAIAIQNFSPRVTNKSLC